MEKKLFISICIEFDLHRSGLTKRIFIYFMDPIVKIGTQGQLRATAALLKFCKDHKHTAFYVAKLQDCLVALEEKDRNKVIEVLGLFKMAGMGSYSDWYPEVICEHEDEEYVETVWWALNANWRQCLSAIE